MRKQIRLPSPRRFCIHRWPNQGLPAPPQDLSSLPRQHNRVSPPAPPRQFIIPVLADALKYFSLIPHRKAVPDRSRIRIIIIIVLRIMQFDTYTRRNLRPTGILLPTTPSITTQDLIHIHPHPLSTHTPPPPSRPSSK